MSSSNREMQQTYARVAAAVSIAGTLSIGFAESNRYADEQMKFGTFLLLGIAFAVFSSFCIWATKTIRVGGVSQYRGIRRKLLDRIESIDPDLELAFFRSLGIPLGVVFVVAAVSSLWSPSDILYAIYGVLWIVVMTVLIYKLWKMRNLHREVRKSGEISDTD